MRSRSRTLGFALVLTLMACGTPQRSRGGGGFRAVADMPVRIGPPYQAGGRTWVPADTRGYDMTGLASWYGKAHRGRPTANGERFDPDRISAAHTTLPLPSYVEVTALASGRTILVRINDRGPFVAGRIIDLSEGAARLLGVDRLGVARVRVRRVYPPESARAALRAGRPAPARGSAGGPPPVPVASSPLPLVPAPRDLAPGMIPHPPPGRAGGGIAGPASIQLSLTDDADRADGVATAAAALGTARIVVVGPMWAVWIGPYPDDASARSALARARQAGYQDARLVRESAQ